MTAELHSIELERDERLIREGEAAVDDYNRSHERARKNIIPMARGLLAARRKYPANQEFGDWLQTSAYRELEKDDRAALINIGQHEEWATKYIRTTKLISPRTIWDAIEELMPSSHDAKTPPQSDTSAIPTDVPVEKPEENAGPLPEKAPESDPAPAKSAGLGDRHPFFGQKRAEEVAAIYLHDRARTTIGTMLIKRGKRAVWDLILETIDAGLLQPTSTSANMPTAKLLFPDAPPSFTRHIMLDKEPDRQRLREHILPALIRHRDEYLTAPATIEDILRRDAREIRERARAEDHARKLTVARETLSANETEVIMFGKHLWPIVTTNDPAQRYDYAQLTAAVWFFDDALRLARLASDNSPKSCGMSIRFLVKRLMQYNDSTPATDAARGRWRQIFGLVNELTWLMEKSPEHVGNRLPALPADKAYQD
jgi:hypothetical protein